MFDKRLYADEVGSACSDAGRVGARGPGDAAGVEEDAEAVVLEAAEAVPGAFDLLDAQVETLGRSVGGAGVVVEASISGHYRRSVLARATISSTSSATLPAMAVSSSTAASAVLSAKATSSRIVLQN